MAAAIIPIITAAAPLLTPLIETLVQKVEGLFGAKNGATKFQSVLDAVLPIAQQLSTAGKIPGPMDPTAIGTMIETVVQNLKAQGQLPSGSATTAVPVAATAMTPGAYSFSGTFKIG